MMKRECLIRFIMCITLILLYPAILNATTVSVDDATATFVGEKISVDISVDSVTDMYGLATELIYDTNFLEVVDVDAYSSNGTQVEITEGIFLNNSGLEESISRGGLEDETQGTLVLGASRSGDVAGVSTTTKQIILSVSFEAKQAGGPSNISFISNSAVKDSTNSDITVTSWTTGSVTIGSLVPPALSATPSPLDFQNVYVRGTSKAKTITVQNSAAAGAVDLQINSVFITGANEDEFTIQNDTCAGQLLTASVGSCTFEVIFNPLSTGARSASAAFSSNLATPGVISLLGTAVSGFVAGKYTGTIDPSDTTAKNHTVTVTQGATLRIMLWFGSNLTPLSPAVTGIPTMTDAGLALLVLLLCIVAFKRLGKTAGSGLGVGLLLLVAVYAYPLIAISEVQAANECTTTITVIKPDGTTYGTYTGDSLDITIVDADGGDWTYEISRSGSGCAAEDYTLSVDQAEAPAEIPTVGTWGAMIMAFLLIFFACRRFKLLQQP